MKPRLFWGKHSTKLFCQVGEDRQIGKTWREQGFEFPNKVRELVALEYLSERNRRIDWDQRQLLECKISGVTWLQNRVWPCVGGWTTSAELRGHGILCVLNVDNKVTWDDGGLYMRR